MLISAQFTSRRIAPRPEPDFGSDQAQAEAHRPRLGLRIIAQAFKEFQRLAPFSSAFSIILNLASDRIAELGCAPIGEDPKAFVDRGGLRCLGN
jgi:hypothetical protein